MKVIAGGRGNSRALIEARRSDAAGSFLTRGGGVSWEGNASQAEIVMADVCEEWGVDVSRGPDWLFLRLRPGKQEPEGMADKIWSLADRHFVYRLVLEMDDLAVIPSHLMGQLVMLQKRVLQREGALRLCGLSKECAEALRFCRLDQALPNFASLEDAVKGQRRSAPHFANA